MNKMLQRLIRNLDGRVRWGRGPWTCKVVRGPWTCKGGSMDV